MDSDFYKRMEWAERLADFGQDMLARKLGLGLN
jgi:hypothetical protein